MHRIEPEIHTTFTYHLILNLSFVVFQLYINVFLLEYLIKESQQWINLLIKYNIKQNQSPLIISIIKLDSEPLDIDPK